MPTKFGPIPRSHYELLRKSALNSEDVAALGITNQRETTLLWNRQQVNYTECHCLAGYPHEDICTSLSANGGADFFQKRTGLPLATYFSGPKIKWMLEHSDQIRKDAENGLVVFGNMDTWLIWNLTGGIQGGIHVTDVTNASRTLLMNLDTLNWDPELVERMGIPASVLPRICSSSEVYGYTRQGLVDVPIAVIWVINRRPYLVRLALNR